MKKVSVLLISIFWVSVISWAANAGDIEATTDEGKQVLLNDDGTWQYVLKAKTDDGKEFLLNNDGTWQSIDSEVSGDLTELDQTVVLIFEKDKEKYPGDADRLSCVMERIRTVARSGRFFLPHLCSKRRLSSLPDPVLSLGKSLLNDPTSLL